MRFTFAELYEIYEGEVASLEDFIALHQSKKDRPDTWFHQQDRRLRAHRQTRDYYRRAAKRDAAV